MFGRKPDRLSITSKFDFVAVARLVFGPDVGQSGLNREGGISAARRWKGGRANTWQNSLPSVSIGSFRKPIDQYKGVSVGNGSSA